MTPLVLWFLAGCSSPPEEVPTPNTPARAAAPPVEADDDAEEEEDEDDGPAGKAPAIGAMRFVPEHPKKGEDIEIQLKVKNPDKLRVSFDYLWSINGTPSYDLTTNVFPGNQATRGDRLSVKVTIRDGDRESSKDSPIVEVGNSPPELKTTAAEFAKLDGLQVRATDPDDDPLSFHFEGAPAGLQIDDEGRVTYAGTEAEKAGTYAVTLVVDDGHTGYAKLPFSISVSGGQSQQRVKKGSTEAASP